MDVPTQAESKLGTIYPSSDSIEVGPQWTGWCSTTLMIANLFLNSLKILSLNFYMDRVLSLHRFLCTSHMQYLWVGSPVSRVAVLTLGIKPRSSWREAGALNHWIISSGPLLPQTTASNARLDWETPSLIDCQIIHFSGTRKSRGPGKAAQKITAKLFYYFLYSQHSPAPPCQLCLVVAVLWQSLWMNTEPFTFLLRIQRS